MKCPSHEIHIFNSAVDSFLFGKFGGTRIGFCFFWCNVTVILSEHHLSVYVRHFLPLICLFATYV